MASSSSSGGAADQAEQGEAEILGWETFFDELGTFLGGNLHQEARITLTMSWNVWRYVLLH